MLLECLTVESLAEEGANCVVSSLICQKWVQFWELFMTF